MNKTWPFFESYQETPTINAGFVRTNSELLLLKETGNEIIIGFNVNGIIHWLSTGISEAYFISGTTDINNAQTFIVKTPLRANADGSWVSFWDVAELEQFAGKRLTGQYFAYFKGASGGFEGFTENHKIVVDNNKTYLQMDRSNSGLDKFESNRFRTEANRLKYQVIIIKVP